MKRKLACLMLGLGACLAAANAADAGHKVRYYISPPAYYVAPPVYYSRPVYVAPAPVVVHQPVYAAPYYYAAPAPVPVFGWQAPVVVRSYPRYYVPRHRRYDELEIKYKWTRRGLRIKYDFDD